MLDAAVADRPMSSTLVGVVAVCVGSGKRSTTARHAAMRLFVDGTDLLSQLENPGRLRPAEDSPNHQRAWSP